MATTVMLLGEAVNIMRWISLYAITMNVKTDSLRQLNNLDPNRILWIRLRKWLLEENYYVPPHHSLVDMAS